MVSSLWGCTFPAGIPHEAELATHQLLKCKCDARENDQPTHHRPIGWRQFLSWCSLFPDDFNLGRVDKSQPAHIFKVILLVVAGMNMEFLVLILVQGLGDPHLENSMTLMKQKTV